MQKLIKEIELKAELLDMNLEKLNLKLIDYETMRLIFEKEVKRTGISEYRANTLAIWRDYNVLLNQCKDLHNPVVDDIIKRKILPIVESKLKNIALLQEILLTYVVFDLE